MPKTLDALIVGSGPVALAAAVMLYDFKKEIGVLCYPKLIERIKNIGDLRLENLQKGVKELREFCIPKDRIGFDINDNKSLIFLTKDYLPGIELKDKGYVAIATKTYSNGQVVEEIKQFTDNTTILLFQNGLHPEIGLRLMLKNPKAKIVRFVIGGGLGLYEGVLKSSIIKFTGGFWDSRVDLDTRLNIIIPSETPSTEEYKKASFSKAIVNSVNSLSSIFAANLGEVLENNFLKEFIDRKIDEWVGIANYLKIDLKAKSVVDNFDRIIRGKLEKHNPSTLQDIFKRLVNPQKDIETEIRHLDEEIFDYGKNKIFGSIGYTSFCIELLNSYIEHFNKLRVVDKEKAREFGLRALVRNRNIIGLEPYAFFKRFDGLGAFEEHIKAHSQEDKLFGQDPRQLLFVSAKSLRELYPV